MYSTNSGPSGFFLSLKFLNTVCLRVKNSNNITPQDQISTAYVYLLAFNTYSMGIKPSVPINENRIFFSYSIN